MKFMMTQMKKLIIIKSINKIIGLKALLLNGSLSIQQIEYEGCSLFY